MSQIIDPHSEALCYLGQSFAGVPAAVVPHSEALCYLRWGFGGGT